MFLDVIRAPYKPSVGAGNQKAGVVRKNTVGKPLAQESDPNLLRQGIEVVISEITRTDGNTSTFKVDINQKNGQDGLIIWNVGAPALLFDVQISGGKLKDPLQMPKIILERNHHRHLLFEQDFDSSHSICFKFNIKLLGIQNVKLIARTVYNEAPNSNFDQRSYTSSFLGVKLEDSYCAQLMAILDFNEQNMELEPEMRKSALSEMTDYS